MSNTIKIEKQDITKERFLSIMDDLSVLLDGRRKEIAKKAGIEYNTYKHYMYGYGTDTSRSRENYYKIYTAALEVAKETKGDFLTAISHIS